MKKTIKSIERKIKKAQRKGEHEVRLIADVTITREILEYLRSKYHVSEIVFNAKYKSTFFSKGKYLRYEGISITF